MDLLVLPAFLDSAEREQVLAELRTLSGAPASVYGTSDSGIVQPHVRSATRLTVSPAVRDAIVARLTRAQQEIERHFDVSLSQCEEPQFLHYGAGDFFVAHQDGNTPLTRDDSRHRRVSVVLFLNDEYGGGELLFHGQYPDWLARHAAPAEPGTLVAFRSETTHEVAPVTHGDRYTIASWYRAR